MNSAELKSNVQLASNLMTFGDSVTRPVFDSDFRKHVRGRKAIERMWEALGLSITDTMVRQLLKKQLTVLQQFEFEPPCGICGRGVAGIVIQGGVPKVVDLCTMGRCYCFRQGDEKPRPQVIEFEANEGMVFHGSRTDVMCGTTAIRRQVNEASLSAPERVEQIPDSDSKSVLRNLLAEALDWLARVEEAVSRDQRPPDRWRQSLLGVIERIDHLLSKRSDGDAL